MLSTENIGGVVVSPNQLNDMQADDYILQVRKWENATGNLHFCVSRWRPV